MSEPRAKPRFAPRKKSVPKAEDEANSYHAAAPATTTAVADASAAGRAVSGSGRPGGGRGDRDGGGRGGGGSRGRGGDRDRGGRSAGGRGATNKSNIANLSGKAFFSGNSGTVAIKGPMTQGRTNANSGGVGIGGNGAPNITIGRHDLSSVKLERDEHGSLLGSEQVEDLAAEEAVGQHASELYDDADFGCGKGSRSKFGRGVKGAAGVFQFNIAAEDASSESDGDGDADLDDVVAPFREQAPFSLKAVPRAVTESAPLLSASADEDMLKKERDENIFLLQMPSSLPLSRVENPAAATTGTAANPQDPEAPVPEASPAPKPGKIGRLQLMASGKLFMVLDSGSKYEVHEGLAATFSQHLVSVSADKGAAGAVKAERGQIVPEAFNNGPHGSLHTMGSVTRKWVVTLTVEEE